MADGHREAKAGQAGHVGQARHAAEGDDEMVVRGLVLGVVADDAEAHRAPLTVEAQHLGAAQRGGGEEIAERDDSVARLERACSCLDEQRREDEVVPLVDEQDVGLAASCRCLE